MIRAIIIDDEERARRVLTSLLTEYVRGVEVVATCENLPMGIKEINKHKPDVVFLDIEMPDYSGLEILDFFNEVDFEIIFATGYSDFAIHAFEMSAIDYLLKPIQIEKLESALEKLRNKLQQPTINNRLDVLRENIEHKSIERIALPVNNALLFVDVNSISRLEAEGSYTKVHTKGGEDYLVSKNLKQFEHLLQYNTIFFRTHRSVIVNINSITKYSKKDNYVLIEGKDVVPISRDKKALFEEYIKDIRI